MNETSYQPSRPHGRPAIRMTWQTLLFAHWRLPPETLRPRVPQALEIDTFDGSAWMGLIPFTMPRFHHRWLPWIPTASSFHECNVRTYVRYRGEPGVLFFSLDAASRLAVWAARRVWRLPYVFARISLEQEGDVVRYSVDRDGDPAARMRCIWRTGPTRARARPGELDHFLTERYMLYTTDRRGRPRRGRIWHEPWPRRDAELIELDDGLVKAAGITVPEEAPVVWCADRLEVEAWPLV